ncbi:MAG: ethylbenzene dehydrogenase-related protein [Candidatus Methylomirabilales bacterium]
MSRRWLGGIGGIALLVLALGGAARAAEEKGRKNLWIPERLEEKLKVKVAFNREDIFFRFQFASVEGIYHDYLHYERGKWIKTKGSAPGIHPDRLYEDRVSFLLDDGSVRHFATQGGYVTIHEEMRFLSSQAPKEEVRKILKKKDVRKYIPETRTDENWRNLRRGEDLEELRQSGVFLDLWQWRAHRSNPVGFADDQWVFQYRNSDEGKGPYTTNWDAEKKQPKWMYNPAKVGFYALNWEDVKNRRLSQQDIYYLSEEIALPFDPNHPWQEGDTIPRRFLRKPQGSRGDIRAVGRWENGIWDVTMWRRLDTEHPLDDKVLRPKRIYHIAFGIHTIYTGSRWHHISFPYTLGLDTEAEIVARRFEGKTPPWDAIPWQTIPLFYPGQTTWTFLTSDAHAGKLGIAEGRACASCHRVSEMGKYAVEHELRDQIRRRWYLTLVGGTVFILGIAVAGAGVGRRRQ